MNKKAQRAQRIFKVHEMLHRQRKAELDLAERRLAEIDGATQKAVLSAGEGLGTAAGAFVFQYLRSRSIGAGLAKEDVHRQRSRLQSQTITTKLAEKALETALMTSLGEENGRSLLDAIEPFAGGAPLPGDSMRNEDTPPLLAGPGSQRQTKGVSHA